MTSETIQNIVNFSEGKELEHEISMTLYELNE